MIVFACTKKEFVEYVDKGIISNKIYDAYKDVFKSKTKLSEIKSWARSLPYLKEVVEGMPDDMGMTFEYNIPLTSKRIDVLLSGYDIMFRPVVVLIEFKGWEYVKVVDGSDAIVRTRVGSDEKNVLHPAYQVLSYANILKSYNENVEKYEILVIPLVYMHNYELRLDGVLYNKKYSPYYKKVVMFGKDDLYELKYFLENNICFGDNLRVINMLEKSDVKPNKKMVEAIEGLINSKKEFNLIDEQKVVMEEIKRLALLAYKNNQKIVLIIKGSPGTGKSVLAINALGVLLSLGLVGAYVTKNMAPRRVYREKLMEVGSDFSVNELFKSSGHFFNVSENKYDFLMVDEAHRLQEKSGLRGNIGENQIMEIIKASRFSVFFIDERQRVTLKDIGSVKLIKEYAEAIEADIYESELISQFRCNGSDNYLEFVESILDNKKSRPSFDFDFRVIDTPVELHNLIKEKNTSNNARLVAGFCWIRSSKYADNQEYHDIVIGDFSISWNLKHGVEFAIRDSAINEAGCIYNVQGLEFDYIGVIIGADLKFKDGLVVTDYKERANTEKSLYGLRVLMNSDKDYYENLADKIIKNTYRVLLTRGIKGCYVYCVDKDLGEYLKRVVNEYKIDSNKKETSLM